MQSAYADALHNVLDPRVWMLSHPGVVSAHTLTLSAAVNVHVVMSTPVPNEEKCCCKNLLRPCPYRSDVETG